MGGGTNNRFEADGKQSLIYLWPCTQAAVRFTNSTPYSSRSLSFQLQEAFGWEPFMHLFAEYQTLSGLPKDKKSKMNIWVKKFSETVQKNLVPFFEAWGWPIQKEVADSLTCLPCWQDHPLNVYMSTKE